MSSTEAPEPLWTPPSDSGQRSRIGAYVRWLAQRGRDFASYEDLWRWSVTDLDGFWSSIWDFFGVAAAGACRPMLVGASMPGTSWCPGATINYAEHALRPGPDAGRVAVVAHSQTRAPITLTVAEFRDQVARARRGLQRLGVGPGDRVVAYLPNIPETLVAFLATASLGAIWSSCAPEFGIRSVIDRFSQVAPAVLLAVDGYRYGPAADDRVAEVAAIAQALPSLVATVWSPIWAMAPARRRCARGAFLGRADRRGGAARVHAVPSTTRCTSCTRRGRPGCPRRSSTAMAESSSST